MTHAHQTLDQKKMGRTFLNLVRRRKYEFLLVALLQHLFISVLFQELELYSLYIWPLSTMLLGLFSIRIFSGRVLAYRAFRSVLNGLAIVFPVIPWFLTPGSQLMTAISLIYLVFFIMILAEVLGHLIQPNYIDTDLISASVCGFLLILETGISLLQAIYYVIPQGFEGLDVTSFTSVYVDLVYYCCVVLTGIGFGDITPTHHISKLATAILGIVGQIYSVILIGILVSKYSAASLDMQE